MRGLLRHLINLLRKFKSTKIESPPNPVVISRNVELVKQCQKSTNTLLDRIEYRYSALAASIILVTVSHSNIEELVKFLKVLNSKLSTKNYQLSNEDVAFNFSVKYLDSFFISSNGYYISDQEISNLAIQSQQLLEHVQAYALFEYGVEEYHFRLLQRLLQNLTDVQLAISEALIED